MDFHLVFSVCGPSEPPKRSTDHGHSKDLADVAKVGWVDGNVCDGWMDGCHIAMLSC